MFQTTKLFCKLYNYYNSVYFDYPFNIHINDN